MRFQTVSLVAPFARTFFESIILLPIPGDARMKCTRSSFLFLVLLGVMVAGCNSNEPRRSTEGASPQDIAEYEAAVAAAEGSMQASEGDSAETPPTPAGQ